MSVKSTMVFESHHSNSSDTDKYSSEDDEDDDVLILHQERKSLFSALKNRMHAVDSSKNSTEHSSRIQRDRVASHCKENYSSQKKRAVKGKRTSSIVDLSFSDDDDDDDLCMRETSDCVISSHVSSSVTQTASKATDCIVVESYKSQNDETAYQKNRDVNNAEYCLKQGKKFVTLPISDHDTDSCEDSDDFPCFLPSTSKSSQLSETSSTGQSCIPDLSSERQTDSQDGCEIPVKRKKRTTEEIISQRNEALVGINLLQLSWGTYSTKEMYINFKVNNSKKTCIVYFLTLPSADTCKKFFLVHCSIFLFFIYFFLV